MPASLDEGDSVELGVKRKNVTGDVSWTSSTPSAATVEQNTGKVTGVSLGTSTITASVTDNGTTYTAQCTITVVASKKDAVNAKIGTVIAYPKATTTTAGYSASYSGTWRIFYADNKQMFIIPTRVAESNYRLSDPDYTEESRPRGSSTYTNYSDDVFAERTVDGKKVTYGLTYNSRWKEKLGNSQDQKTRSIATAYLCDPANWTSYVASNAPEGTYAVGGPTKELLVLSWNAAKDNNITGAPTTEAIWGDRDVTYEGYEFYKPDALYSQSLPFPITSSIVPIIENEREYGLYNCKSEYWLASPCSDRENTVCILYSRGVSGRRFKCTRSRLLGTRRTSPCSFYSII